MNTRPPGPAGSAAAAGTAGEQGRAPAGIAPQALAAQSGGGTPVATQAGGPRPAYPLANGGPSYRSPPLPGTGPRPGTPVSQMQQMHLGPGQPPQAAPSSAGPYASQPRPAGGPAPLWGAAPQSRPAAAQPSAAPGQPARHAAAAGPYPMQGPQPVQVTQPGGQLRPPGAIPRPPMPQPAHPSGRVGGGPHHPGAPGPRSQGPTQPGPARPSGPPFPAFGQPPPSGQQPQQQQYQQQQPRPPGSGMGPPSSGFAPTQNGFPSHTAPPSQPGSQQQQRPMQAAGGLVRPPPGQPPGPSGPPSQPMPGPRGPSAPPMQPGMAPLMQPPSMQPPGSQGGPQMRPTGLPPPPGPYSGPPSAPGFGPGGGPRPPGPGPATPQSGRLLRPPPLGVQFQNQRPRSPGSPPPYAIGMPGSPEKGLRGSGQQANSRFAPPGPYAGAQQPSLPRDGGGPNYPPTAARPPGGPGYPAGAGYGQGYDPRSSQGSRIDPTQIPRPAVTSAQPAVFETRTDGKHSVPPPSSLRFVVRDVGDASPRCMRSTLNNVPCTADLLKQSGMPLAIVVQPFALPGPGDDPIEVVDFGESGPLRCGRCKAYINPFMRFQDSGRKFQCNFCSHVNDTPFEYITNVGPDGRRRDADERPELCKGSVEFVASGQYMVRPPMPPVHFFLIDVSYSAVSSGATAAVCSAVARTLDDLQGSERTRVAVATFDSTIHFYSLQASQSQPQMLVVPDIDDPYSPLPASLLVPLQESRAVVDSLLESIPRMFAHTQVGDACGGAAVQAAVQALKAGVGGKLHVFMTLLPKIGVRSLTSREGKVAGDKDAQAGQVPANKEWAKLAEEAAEYQVCIDLFVLARSHVDIATLQVLCRATGGQLYHYCPFTPALDADQVFNDLRWNLLRPQGMEAVARLRCSQGLTVDSYTGSFFKRTATDIDLPAISSDQSLLVTLRHEEKLAEQAEACVQFAILYTTTTGERRIRLHTLSLPTTAVLGHVYRGADLDAQINYIGRTSAGHIPGATLAACREAVTKACVDVLFTYRKQCAQASSSGQLILPEALKLLPLYSLALTKTPTFRPETSLDVRAAWIQRFTSLPCARTVPLLYPRLLPLHHLAAPDQPDQPATMPEAVDHLGSDKLDPDGIYLLENGYEAYIHIGKQAPPELLRQLIGVETLESVSDPKQPLTLPQLDNAFNRAVHGVMDAVRQERCAFMALRVLKRGDPLETFFFNSLVEDRSQAGMSYVEHLCAVHRQIQGRMN